MADVVSKCFEKPDDVVEFPSMRTRIVELGDLTVGELVSELTRALAGAAGLVFEDRGTHTFKGLDGEWGLAAFVSE